MIIYAESVQDQRNNVRALGNNGVLYLLDDPKSEGICRIYGSGFSEELPSLVRSDMCPLYQDASDPVLIGKDAV